MKTYTLFSALVLNVSLGLHMVNAMDVEAAYAAIPHQRTVYDVSKSRLSMVQKDSLKQLFNWSDKATVLRVEGWQAYRAGNLAELARVVAAYKPLTSSLMPILTPTIPELKPVQELVLQAMQGQQAYFEKKLRERQAGAKADAVFTPEVYQASQKLKQAYSLLMQNYPGEVAQNKQAFYDYLCALDFL